MQNVGTVLIENSKNLVDICGVICPNRLNCTRFLHTSLSVGDISNFIYIQALNNKIAFIVSNAREGVNAGESRFRYS